MMCPECSGKTAVLESRCVEEDLIRRRKCAVCGWIFSTAEVVITGHARDAAKSRAENGEKEEQ